MKKIEDLQPLINDKDLYPPLPLVAKLLHPVATVDPATIHHYADLSDSLKERPPLPIDQRPGKEQQFINKLASVVGMDPRELLQTLTTVNMRDATTVIIDRETKSKILIIVTD